MTHYYKVFLPIPYFMALKTMIISLNVNYTSQDSISLRKPVKS